MNDAAAARLGSLNNLHAHRHTEAARSEACEHGAVSCCCLPCLRSDLDDISILLDMERATSEGLRGQRHALMTAIKTIEANCLVWQTGESEMSAGDFLALIQREADEAMKGAKP